MNLLNLAACAVIALIAFNQIGTGLAASRGLFVLIGSASSLLVFFLAFIIGALVGDGPRAATVGRAMLVIQVLAALLNLTIIYDSSNPILLILIAAQLPAFVSLSRTAAILAVLNIIVYVLLREVHDQSRALFNILVYSSFETFALVTAHYAYVAERANKDLVAVNAHLLATRSLLEEGARDGERLRLSRELHDVAGHTLTALKLHLELAQRLPDIQQRRDRIDAAQKLTDALLDDIRCVVSQLRRYDGIDLPDALSALCTGFPGIDIRLDLPPALRVTDVERAEAILRAVQEALTNAVRHGKAGRVNVQIGQDARNTTIRIADDGRGARDPSPGNGLTGMRERLSEWGGRVDIQTKPGDGFVLTITLPDGAGSLP